MGCSATLEEQIASLDKQYASLQVEDDWLDTGPTTPVLSDEDVDSLLQFQADIAAGLASATYEDKRKYSKNWT